MEISLIVSDLSFCGELPGLEATERPFLCGACKPRQGRSETRATAWRR